MIFEKTYAWAIYCLCKKYSLKGFKNLKLWYFEKDTADGVNTLDLAHHQQSNLLEKLLTFSNRARPKTNGKKTKNTYESLEKLYEGGEMVLNVFESGTSPIKNAIQVITTHMAGKGIKTWSPN